MSLLTEPFNPRYLEALEQFRLIDDTFFDAHMDGEYSGNDDVGLLNAILRPSECFFSMSP